MKEGSQAERCISKDGRVRGIIKINNSVLRRKDKAKEASGRDSSSFNLDQVQDGVGSSEKTSTSFGSNVV
jgi:hypothetical protein